MRFEERLRPRFNIDPAVARARLPSLLLQPLVENAIKYAVTPQEEGADIAVEARKIGDRVVITVSDTGPGADGQALWPERKRVVAGKGVSVRVSLGGGGIQQ